VTGDIELRLAVANGRIATLTTEIEKTIDDIVVIVTKHGGSERAAAAEPREMAALYGKFGYLGTALAATGMRIAEQLEAT